MEISIFTLKLILLLTPGGVAALIYQKLTIYKKWSPFEFIVHSILFGGLSYLVVQFISHCCADDSEIWSGISTNEIPFKVIAWAFAASIGVGIACTALNHFKVINKIGKWLKITNKYGDESLFFFFLGAKEVTEVYIRDFDKNIMYHGLVSSYSESEKSCEILLRSVNVYELQTSVLLYELDMIYISQDKMHLQIEVPAIEVAQPELPFEENNQ